MRTLAILAICVAVAVPGRARADECPVNGLDCLAVSQFSATADATSDAFFLTALALPIGLELGRGLDDDVLRRGAAYTSAVGATALTALAVKYAVRRDRPYTYNRHPGVVEYTAQARGNDHSFFSGHTSLAFAAVTSGALLYNPTSHDATARLGIWGGAGAIAATTGVLRIRAGQHFPTDVLVGAVIGTGFGLGLTYALAPERDLRGSDLGALAVGVAVGALAGALVPLPRDVRLPLGARDLAVVPTVAPGAAGLSLSASLR
ncbi:MAG: phosphatase PAP2 family protein [Myxococcales bacterium]|nr:phosphatase PAP2 family protein [Myxococcales bacterium]